MSLLNKIFTTRYTGSLLYLGAALLTLGFIVNSVKVDVKTPCRIVYDAGSSGTRLFIYELHNTKWREHVGPKVSALADPVREILDRQWADAEAVVAEVVNSLEQIKVAGPVDDEGQVKWPAFDWSEQCRVVSASVYATAGMRIAEQQNPDRSRQLWQKLKQRLSAKIPKNVTVSTRTLTGFEEGLYAWLSVRQISGKDDFGIVEMGGASSQLTFPCDECPSARIIRLADQSHNIFSYSFLGLGGDEAFEILGNDAACQFGAAKQMPGWTEQACARSISIQTSQGIRDPYNIGEQGRGRYQVIPVHKAEADSWVLTGAFYYMKDSDLDNCCILGKESKCHNPDSSCFRSVYFRKYLRLLGIDSYSTAESSWTLGAVICQENDCLRDSGKLKCRWMDGDCL